MKQYTIKELEEAEKTKGEWFAHEYPGSTYDMELPQGALYDWANWAKEYMPEVTYDMIASTTSWIYEPGDHFGKPITICVEVQRMLDAIDGKLHGWVAMYDGQKKEMWLSSDIHLWGAKELAVAEFQKGRRAKVKSHMVTCMVAWNGKPVVHETPS